MRIQEVAPLVGITKKNIRFYEQEGLLHPRRSSTNGYRDYSDEDVLLLSQIRLLRQLGVPLEEIRQLQSGSLTVGDAMTRQGICLRREIRNLELSAALCQEMEQLSLPLSQLDPGPYLAEMEQLKQKGAYFMNQHKQDVKKRITAPIIAAAVMVLLMAALIGVMLWGQSVDPLPLPILILFLLIPLAVIVGVLLALRSRLQELRRGEEEDAAKY